MRIRSSRVTASRTPAWLQATLALTTLLAASSCSAPPGAVPEDDDSDVPEFGGTLPGAPAGQPGVGSQTPPAPGATGSTNTGAVTPPSAPSAGNEQNAGNAPLSPAPSSGAGGSANAGSNSGSQDSGSQNNGSQNGAGGSSMVPPFNPGDQGAGGSSMGGDNGGNNPPPANPPPANPPPANPPPANPPPANPPPTTPPPATGPDTECPADATFCSGFESDALPDGAIYQGNPGLEFDTAIRRSGNRSVVFNAVDGFNIREVVTDIPGQSFWARLFVQTSTTFGDNDHDSLFVASTANFQQDNNAEDGPEFSEQGNQILINSNDQLFSAAGAGFPQGMGPQLTPNVWHCVEAFYDGGSGDVQFFVGGQQIISAPGFSRLTYATFRFGYLQFPGHVPHVVHYDDVVVAASRVGCN